MFDGWAGSNRVVEPTTITDDEWAYLCAPQGLPDELYNLQNDPAQERNVVDEHPEVAQRMRAAWVEFLQRHGAPEERIRPFVEADAEVHTPPEGRLFAFRDELGQWIAFHTEAEAGQAAHREDAPGPQRPIEEITFGALLDDNPRNLVHLYGQYYWAEDLA